MSGTSLDGLDIAACKFRKSGSMYNFELIAATTIKYNKYWKKKLSKIYYESADTFFKINAEYGYFLGKQVKKFAERYGIKHAIVCSHGHTVFHRPKDFYTTQIGSGAHIAAASGLHVICDFRSSDVAKKGQGAPLVPIGDKLLFNAYGACLNLGGIANISFDNQKGLRKAYDICICNMALNHISKKAGKELDFNGQMAASGKVIAELLNDLNKLFYRKKITESLGFEFFESKVMPILNNYRSKQKIDILATLSEHIAEQIAVSIKKSGAENCLISGGGAFNKHLVSLIKQKSGVPIIIPKAEIINFKEAMIFSFLGYLRWNNETNIWASVTGASSNSSGGAIYL